MTYSTRIQLGFPLKTTHFWVLIHLHNNISPPEKIPGRKPDSEAGCIFEYFTPKQGNSLKILVAGTRNRGVSLPPPPHPGSLTFPDSLEFQDLVSSDSFQ